MNKLPRIPTKEEMDALTRFHDAEMQWLGADPGDCISTEDLLKDAQIAVFEKKNTSSLIISTIMFVSYADLEDFEAFEVRNSVEGKGKEIRKLYTNCETQAAPYEWF